MKISPITPVNPEISVPLTEEIVYNADPTYYGIKIDVIDNKTLVKCDVTAIKISVISSMYTQLYENHTPLNFESMHINNSVPVNGHHPQDKNCRIYPELKHTLSHEDIGKIFVRSYPQCSSSGIYDWSWIPSRVSKESVILDKIDGSSIKYYSKGAYRNVNYKSQDDGYWIPLDEWKAFSEMQKQDSSVDPLTSSQDPISVKKKIPSSLKFSYKREPILLKTSKSKMTFNPLRTVKEAEDWISYIKNSNLDAKDHSLKLDTPVKKERKEKFQINFSSLNPREVLGLYSDEENISTIKKAYYKLSLKYHPDKCKKGTEAFQIIESAYHKLMHELQGSPFLSDANIPFELESHSAMAWFSFLKTNSKALFRIDGQKVIEMWAYFKDQLILTLKKNYEKNAASLKFLRLLPRVETYLIIYEIRISLEKLCIPTADQSIDDQINNTKESITALDNLIVKFDQSIKNWSFEEIEALKKINDYLSDKKMAWSRSLVILYVKKNSIKNALFVKNEIFIFYRLRQFRLLEAIGNAEIKRIAFDLEQKASNKFSEKKESPKVTDNNESPKIEEKLPKTNQEVKNPKVIDLLKENIERNLNFFKGISKLENIPKVSPLEDCTDPVFKKWMVNLPKEASYRKNTNDFGIEILELLLSEVDKGLLPKTFKDMAELSSRLGIEIKRTKTQVPVRDYLFQLHTGDIKKQFKTEFIEKGVLRAQSKALYLNEKGFTRTSSDFFKVSMDEQLLTKNQVYSNENNFKDYVTKENLCFHAEGGNMFTLTNPKGEVKVLLGRDHLYSSLSVHRQAKSLDTYLANIPQKTKNQLKESLTSKKILRIAEEMYAQGMILQNNQSGFLDHNQITKVLYEMYRKNNHITSNRRGDNNFRQTAISMGMFQPFDKTDPEKYRETVAKYLLQKYCVTKLIAEDLSVEPEDIVSVPQLHYHLDTFLKPGPNHSLFLANFSMCADILEKVITEAESLKLSQQDIELLKRYLKTAQKMHLELGSLLDEIEKKTSKAGFPVIPMPGMFMCDGDSSGDNSTHHINFINALSGWSAKINNYYYVTTGAKVGEKLGDIFQDIFKKFLETYQPGIEVSFLGGEEGMEQWNNVMFQSGIHCFSFETKTASHS